jgi:hypothetical protein
MQQNDLIVGALILFQLAPVVTSQRWLGSL